MFNAPSAFDFLLLVKNACRTYGHSVGVSFIINNNLIMTDSQFLPSFLSALPTALF